jgi:hypothetical protein
VDPQDALERTPRAFGLDRFFLRHRLDRGERKMPSPDGLVNGGLRPRDERSPSIAVSRIAFFHQGNDGVRFPPDGLARA